MEVVVTEEIMARQSSEAQAIIRLLLARIAKLESDNAELRSQSAALKSQIATWNG